MTHGWCFAQITHIVFRTAFEIDNFQKAGDRIITGSSLELQKPYLAIVRRERKFIV
jgi:hypothetical protein